MTLKPEKSGSLLLTRYPEYRKNVIAVWKSDYEKSGSGIPRPRTFTVRCKDGTDREILFRPVTLSDGKECVVYEDISEHRKTWEGQILSSSIVEGETGTPSILSPLIFPMSSKWHRIISRFSINRGCVYG